MPLLSPAQSLHQSSTRRQGSHLLTVAIALALGSSPALAVQPVTATAAATTASSGAAQRHHGHHGKHHRHANKDNDQESVKLKGIEVEATTINTPASPKFTAPPVDISRSVSVVPDEIIDDISATSLQDALMVVPGITFGAGEGGTPIADRPSIRGFNSTSNMFVDGLRDIGAQSREIFAVEQLEVVKGPDSTLSGRGSGGGSINVVSKTPKDYSFLKGSVRLGNADNQRVTADGNWRFADHAAARLNVMWDEGGVPGRDDAVQSKRHGFASSVTLGLDSPTRATLDYYYLKDEGTPDYGVPNDPVTGLPITEVAPVDPENFYGLTDRDFRDQETESATLTIEHDFNRNLTLRSRTRVGQNSNSYVVTNPDDSAGNVVNGELWRSSKSRWSENDGLITQLDLTGQASTGSIEHSFDIGASFSTATTKRDRLQVDSIGPRGRDCTAMPELFETYDCTSLYDPNPDDPWQGTITRSHNPDTVHTVTRAVYAFDTITFSPHWKANVGLRWDSYHTKAKRPSSPDENANSEDSFVNYQLGLVYKPVENGSIYLATGTSTTPAALGSGDSDSPTVDHEGRRGPVQGNYNLDPEETRSIELGTKWQLFDRRLLVTAAVFDERRKNAVVEVEPGTFASVGETRVKGMEVSASGYITSKWQLFGGYSYLDGEVTRGDYNASSVNRPLVNTPENAFSLWTSYNVLPQLEIGGGAFYRSEQISSLANPSRGTPDKRIPSFWRVDFTAAWQFNPHFRLQLNVQNLFDELYYSKSYYHYAIPAAGRTFLLTLDMSL